MLSKLLMYYSVRYPLYISTQSEAIPCRHAELINSRYFVLIRAKRNPLEAEELCIEMGGHLASIHNVPEKNKIYDYIKHNG